MRKIKWIFFGYLAAIVLVVIGIALSFASVPARDADTLYAIYDSDIKTLDPAEVSDVPSSRIAGNIFENLYNYDYFKRPYVVIPELAAAMPEISDGGKQYLIHLRKGVHYYDPDKKVFPGDGVGPEIKAGDFIYAWKRMTSYHLPNSNSTYFDQVLGVDEWQKYTESCKEADVDYNHPIAGFTAVDDYTIQIKLVEPYPQLIFVLAHLPTAPMCRAVVDYYDKLDPATKQIKHEVRKHPIGSGPYCMKFSDNQPQQRITINRNPIYRGGPQVTPGEAVAAKDRTPRVPRIQFDYFEEELPPWYMFRQGLLDYRGIPKDAYGQAMKSGGTLTEDMTKAGIQLVKEPEPSCWYYGFNMTDPVVGKNKPLRQAMSLAINREEYIKLFLNGRGEPAIGPIVPGFSAYDEHAKNPYTQFNLELAREKLKEAEKIQGGKIPKIRMLVGDTSTTVRQMGEYMQRSMEKIGIELEPEYTNWANFLDQVERKKSAQFYQLAWNTDWPDEQNILQLFYSKNITEGGLNSANYNNPEFDKLYEKAKVMTDGPERMMLYRKMADIIIEDCPWLMTHYRVDYLLHHRWIKNLLLADYVHGWMAYIEIDKDLRNAGLPK